MKTQHRNIHQYLKDILNILSQRISDDFVNTTHMQLIFLNSFDLKCRNVCTHAHIPTVLKYAFSESVFQAQPGYNIKDNELLIM